MSTHDIHALSGAYAVDALDDVERAQFRQHLAECPECRGEVVTLQEAATLLGGLDASAPPPALRDRVLADIKTTRPLPPEVPGPAARRRPWLRPLVAAAVVAGTVGLGTVVVDQVRTDGTSQSQLSAADKVLGAPDARTVSAALPGGARARIVHSASQGKAVLITSSMPAAPKGKVYELWWQSPTGDMIPAGLMTDAYSFDRDATAAKGVGLTVEPVGGSKAPTSAPIALFDLTASA